MRIEWSHVVCTCVKITVFGAAAADNDDAAVAAAVAAAVPVVVTDWSRWGLGWGVSRCV